MYIHMKRQESYGNTIDIDLLANRPSVPNETGREAQR